MVLLIELWLVSMSAERMNERKDNCYEYVRRIWYRLAVFVCGVGCVVATSLTPGITVFPLHTLHPVGFFALVRFMGLAYHT